jgi:hypothetical protein
LLIVLLSLLSLLSCIGLSWVGFHTFICADEMGATAPAYNTAVGTTAVAYVQARNCGATSAYDTGVYIKLPRRFRPDVRSGKLLTTTLPPSSLSLAWDSLSQQLIVEYPPGEDQHITNKVASWQGIAIRYRARRPAWDSPSTP